MIKLTNAAEPYVGNTIIINPRYIISIFDAKDNDGNIVTYVFSSNKDTWQVKETSDEIYKQL